MNKEEELIRKKSPVNIKNKKASFEYFFIETFTAGIVLTGTEIKSIRMGKASLVDTYCTIINGEIWGIYLFSIRPERNAPKMPSRPMRSLSAALRNMTAMTKMYCMTASL